ncbi:MAG TPA: hypothetical protein PLN91_09735 [Rhodanobacteraceae bacterium]|nr:hypothetical protein [Rhodanobacteraceae bacterium]
MSVLTPIVSRLRNPRSRTLRAGVLLLAGAAVLSALAAQTHRHAPAPAAATVEEPVVAPLPGRDYSMRLDLQRGRVQFYADDAHLAAIAPAGARDCTARLAALDRGLWLAVPQARADGGSELVLEPLGATAPTRRGGVTVAACGASGADELVLAPALRQRILQRGGGVLFVDGGAAQNAAAGAAASLASKVP